jgi:hypothetical protein
MMLITIRRDISKPFIADVSESDAKKLISWWNANTNYYHFKQKQNYGKLWNVIRQT